MSAETIPAEVLYLIRKGGLFYRPNSQGYTAHTFDAGRYTLAEAEAITHPNGPDGRRDGLSYVPAPADRSTRPAEPAAPVAEAGDGDVVGWFCLDLAAGGVKGFTFSESLAKQRDGYRYLGQLAWEVYPVVRLSALEAERARADAAEQRAADALARAEKRGSVWAAAQSLFASASTTYRKRNGQIGSIEGDDGEISYIVPFDAVETLRMAAAEQVFASSGNDTAEGALAAAREDSWRSIAPEDCEVATVQTFGTLTLRNSHPAWVRDDDGRTYEAVWTVDDRGRAYWWDIEAESPVDPVAIYPHPLAARASREAQPATDGGEA